jgi:hypothetical protein
MYTGNGFLAMLRATAAIVVDGVLTYLVDERRAHGDPLARKADPFAEPQLFRERRGKGERRRNRADRWS